MFTIKVSDVDRIENKFHEFCIFAAAAFNCI